MWTARKTSAIWNVLSSENDKLLRFCLVQVQHIDEAPDTITASNDSISLLLYHIFVSIIDKVLIERIEYWKMELPYIDNIQNNALHFYTKLC